MAQAHVPVVDVQSRCAVANHKVLPVESDAPTFVGISEDSHGFK